MSNLTKIMFWPDSHFPKEDKPKIKATLAFVKAWQPERLVFLGDLDDMEAPSRFSRGLAEEWAQRLSVTSKATSRFLEQVRAELPDTEIELFFGNHEHRLIKYVHEKAPALEDTVTYETIYPLKRLGIKWYHYDSAPVEFAKGWYFHHGEKISRHSAYTPKAHFDSWGGNGFHGHTHRLGAYYKTELQGQYQWFECGHLSSVPKQTYVNNPNWQHGFGYAYIDGSKVYPYLAAFQGNSVVVEGRKFTDKGEIK